MRSFHDAPEPIVRPTWPEERVHRAEAVRCLASSSKPGTIEAGMHDRRPSLFARFVGFVDTQVRIGGKLASALGSRVLCTHGVIE